MVWGTTAYTTRSTLIMIRGTMSAQRYIHDILNDMCCHLCNGCLSGVIFQQDNACPHMARKSQDCLRFVTTLLWPARSADLSPIEYIWDHLRWRVGPPTSFNYLEPRVQQIWNEMSHDIIENLYASMPDRMASCIHDRGGSKVY
ncbi:transposable element Tcb1 transposase [Trichonephila clavipes]|nr:transposable element Tcb1 transposase [Trichonephila clavipes]